MAILFLMLASVIMIAEQGVEEKRRTISSSSWAREFLDFSSFLFTKLKAKQSENLSMIQCPGENSESRGEKEGKIP